MKTFERTAAIITLLLFIAAAGVAAAAQSLHVSSPVEITVAAPVPQTTAPAQGRININTADIDTLCQLDGIGPALAGRIVEYREEYGDFSSVAGIIDVKGIGLVTFEKIKDRITVDLS